MARVKLKNKRLGNTVDVMHTYHNGNEQKLVVTYGPSEDGRRVIEAFCASFPVGSDMMTLAIDASILMSRCLQHGDSISELAETLCDPPSIIGTIARRGVLEESIYEEENNASRSSELASQRTAGPQEEDAPTDGGAENVAGGVLLHILGALDGHVRAVRKYLSGRRVR